MPMRLQCRLENHRCRDKTIKKCIYNSLKKHERCMRICGNNSRKRLGILYTTAKINISKKKFVHRQKMDVLLKNGGGGQ